MICANRGDEPGLLMSCTVDLGGGKAGCKCRVEVEESAAEVRKARVPDSAKETS